MPKLSSRLTPWSVLTVLLALPVWWSVLHGAVLGRAVDGGIFLSVAGGINRGLPLYSGVWDNKDPLFYGVMAVADRVSPWAPFLLDWLWIPLACVGAWLLARAWASADRALVVALLAAPLIITGLGYVAGWSSTPGTAMALLALGLLVRGRSVAAGIALGLLVFTKLALVPALGLLVVVLCCIPSQRRTGVRALVSAAGTVLVGILLLAGAGWLPGLIEMLRRNASYASDAMTYFGYSSDVGGRFSKLSADAATGVWVAIGVIVVIAVVAGIVAARDRHALRVLMLGALTTSIVAAGLVLALTYVWPHHVQVLALPAVVAAACLAGLIPSRWPLIAALPMLLAGAVLLGGWIPPSTLIDRLQATSGTWATASEAIETVPLNATLVNSIPGDAVRFAVLGTNDDEGFLRDVRPGAVLGCPQFHLYDFSPISDFDRAWACLDTVDAVVVTDGFAVFAQGGRKASAEAILGKVGSAFTCSRVADRQLCMRRS